MTVSTVAAFAAALCFTSATVWAAVMDISTLKIRNEVVLFLIATYAALAPLAGFGLMDMGLSAAAAIGVMACMFVFFAFGWIGGGDAKLAAAVALWLGMDHTLLFLVFTALAGGLLTLALLQFRLTPLPAICLRVPWIAQLHSRGSGVPYGVAIASGALLVFPSTSWMGLLT